jgi:hypothetical protein
MTLPNGSKTGLKSASSDARLTHFELNVRKRKRGRPGRTTAAIVSIRAKVLVFALVDKRPLFNPRHHLAQLGADVFDRMLG